MRLTRANAPRDTSPVCGLLRSAPALAGLLLTGSIVTPGAIGAQAAVRPAVAPPRHDAPALVHASTTVDAVGDVSDVSAPVLDREAGGAPAGAIRMRLTVTSRSNAPYALLVRRRKGAAPVAVRTAPGVYVALDTAHWTLVARGEPSARNADVVRLQLDAPAASRRLPVEAPLRYRVIARTRQ